MAICFEEIVASYLLLEKISKAQQEAGQREMKKENIKPFIQLKKYLVKKWNRPGLTKEEIKQKKEEFKNLNYLIAFGLEMSKSTDEDVQEYVKDNIGSKPEWFVMPSETVFGKDSNKSGLVDAIDSAPSFLALKKLKLDDKEIMSNGLKIKEPTENIKKIIRKFTIAHEYGHLFEYLKSLVENTNGEIIDTMNGKTSDVVDSEGKANAYAIDNMYRKDRRELLKKSGLKNSDLKASEERLNKGHYKSDEYLAGTRKHSKTVERILNSIDKESGIKRLREEIIFNY